MSTAKRYLPPCKVDDYVQWDGEWELWDGIPVAITPSPLGRHQRVASRIFLLLQNQLNASDCGAEAV